MMDKHSNSIALTTADNQCKNVFFAYLMQTTNTKPFYIFLFVSNIETSCATFNRK